MTDIIDDVNEDFQNGQTILRGRRVPQLLARAFELRTENKRMRAALENIAHGPVGYWNEPQYHEQVIHQLVREATEALRPNDGMKP
jgi:hypothetical protein